MRGDRMKETPMTTSPTSTGLDVRQLCATALPEVDFPGGRNQDFRIFFEPKVHDEVRRHATENVAVEICGVLVGRWARDAEGPFVRVAESIRGEAATSKFAEVTFTHGTWAKINAEMDSRFADLAIVGWYHSHPDFGVFLSDRDRFIQEHFFSGPGQVAYVVDPIRRTEGVFTWQAGKPTLAPHYWVGDRLQVATAAGEEAPSPEQRAAGPTAGSAAPLAESGRKRLDLFSLFTQAALVLMAFLVGFLLAGKVSDVDRVRTQQDALVRGYFARQRPGLAEDVNQAGLDMLAAREQGKKLAEQHLKLAPDSPETRDQWQELLTRLERSLQMLARIQAAYCLTSEEQAALKGLEAHKAPAGPAGPAPEKNEPAPRETKPEPPSNQPNANSAEKKE
jgi:proteasome lid subunit RPN8/RPN11